jgi:hypothetical protein
MALMEGWPDESKEAAQLVIDKYGDPDEATDSVLIWNKAGPWKRTRPRFRQRPGTHRTGDG